MKDALSDKPLGLYALIAVQSLCAAFFITDVFEDGSSLGWVNFLSSHFVIEMIAAVSLIAAVVIEVRFVMSLLRRKARLEKQVSLSAQAFQEVIEDFFDQWQLTPAERDIALFTIKGFGISDVANMRGSAEGTVKAHLNAIYRKAAVANRGELVSLLIEDLMESRG